MWFFFQFRDEGSHRTVPGHVRQREHGRPDQVDLVADKTRPGRQAGSWRNAALRLTVAADDAQQVQCLLGPAAPVSGRGRPRSDRGMPSVGRQRDHLRRARLVESAVQRDGGARDRHVPDGYGQRVQQATWTSPVNNKLLLEAGFGTYSASGAARSTPAAPSRNLVGVTEQCTADCAANGSIADLTTARAPFRQNLQGTSVARVGVLCHRRAEHEVRLSGRFLNDNQYTYTNDQFLAFRVNNGMPNQITENINPFPPQQRVRYDSFYGQEQWTIGRMTLQGALRYDRAWSYFPEVTVGPVPSCRRPSRTRDRRRAQVQRHHAARRRGVGCVRHGQDVGQGQLRQVPAGGAERPDLCALRPTGRLHDHGDADVDRRERDFVPDCDLLNPLASTRRRVCGQISDLELRQRACSPATSTELSTAGACARRLAVRRVGPAASAAARLGRSRLQPPLADELHVDDNRPAGDQRFRPVQRDGADRLAAAGRRRVGRCGSLQRQPERVASHEQRDDAGERLRAASTRRSTTAFLLNVSARPRNGLVFQGGMSTGNDGTDYCDVRAASPE